MTSSGIPLQTFRAKSMALIPCGHRSDKNRIYAAKELKQHLKHCKQLRKLYLQTEKVKKKMLQAINQIPLQHLGLYSKDINEFIANNITILQACINL
jgi:hypothetical protein